MKKTALKSENNQLINETLSFLQDKNNEILLNIDKTTELNILNKREVKMKIRSAMSQMRSPANMDNMRQMANIDFSQIPRKFYDEDQKEINTSDLEPDETTPENLPANISKELREEGLLDIKWTDVEDLPMAQQEDIKALGKAVFSAFNIDENAQVTCINTFKDNAFLNEPKEINAVLGYLDKFANSPHKGVMIQDFGRTIEGYKPEIKLYHTPTKAYLVVNEPEGQGFEGRYIYAFKRKEENKLKNEKRAKLKMK